MFASEFKKHLNDTLEETKTENALGSLGLKTKPVIEQ
jgi:hypothetical protein